MNHSAPEFKTKFTIWKKTMTCICGEKLSLDILGKNFKEHITTNPRHLKLLRKLWKIKNRQKI